MRHCQHAAAQNGPDLPLRECALLLPPIHYLVHETVLLVPEDLHYFVLLGAQVATGDDELPLGVHVVLVRQLLPSG